MKKKLPIQLKNENILRKKKQLNLALNILISILGISSLFIKFFLVDGVLAFRAFTVDGNLFTTIVSIIAVIVNIKELAAGKENESRRMYFLQLASAVTEAVIFIVVMIGYLPVFPDDPAITPYHMFCLHVAIPILAVLRFIFFNKPCGILKPSKLLIGMIPIAVYGIGVVNAIKFGILPIALVPYSFLDFDSNFLWYVVFALVVIPSFGFLWSWMFYRLNLRASLLWYLKEDVEKLENARIKAKSHFDVVNSSILLIYCVLATIVLMFSLRGMSVTTTKVQHELTSDIAFYMLDDYSNMINDDPWIIRNGNLYKGEMLIGDGTEENGNKNVFPDKGVRYDYTIYVPAVSLTPETAAQYDGTDFVAVSHSSGQYGLVKSCGETLGRKIVADVIASEDHRIYESVKQDNTGYYHFCMAFGEDMWNSGVGIIELYFPSAQLTEQAKRAEFNHDIVMIAVIVAAFALLYALSNTWIRVLEKSFDFLKAIACGRTPEEPIRLGKTGWFSGLERQLNIIREINKD